MHLQPIFKNCIGYKNGTSEKLFEKGLCLPSGSNSTAYELRSVIKLLTNF